METKRIFLTAQVVLLFCLIATLSYGQQAYRRWPGGRSELVSPDGRYVLLNVNNDHEPHHSIFLKDKSSGTQTKMYEYDRSATVLWAPDGKHFALNDYGGSDFAETYIIALDGSRIDVSKHISDYVPAKPSHRNFSWDHAYFAVSRWIDSRRAIVNFWGHGADPRPNSGCVCYVYSLDNGVKECVKQPRSSDLEGYCGRITP